MGCGCGRKKVAGKTVNNQPNNQSSVNNTSAKTPSQVRKERVNKLISIPGTKPK